MSIQWLPTDDLALHNPKKSECAGTPPLKITSDNSCRRSLKFKFSLLLSRLVWPCTCPEASCSWPVNHILSSIKAILALKYPLHIKKSFILLIKCCALFLCDTV